MKIFKKNIFFVLGICMVSSSSLINSASLKLDNEKNIFILSPKKVFNINSSNHHIYFDELPIDQSIKTIKGNGLNKIAVFYEIDCAYCRHLEMYELSKIKDATVYTFLFTNDENQNSVSWKKAESIWCAANVNQAWQDFIFKDDIATNYEACRNPIKENKMLALKLGVKATPTIIFSNGNKAVGMIKAKDIEQRFLDANFYLN